MRKRRANKSKSSPPLRLDGLPRSGQWGNVRFEESGIYLRCLREVEQRDQILAGFKSLKVAEGPRMSFDLRAESRGLTEAGREKLDKFLPG